MIRNISILVGCIHALFFLSGCRECINDDGEWDEEKCIEICSEIGSQEKCDETQFETPEGHMDFGHSCTWVQFHETTVDENGNCSYGEMTTKCVYSTAGEGGNCSGLYCEDESGEPGIYVMEDDHLNVAYYERGDRIFVTTDYTSYAQHTSLDIVWCEWVYHNDMGNEYYTAAIPSACNCPCNDDFPGWD